MIVPVDCSLTSHSKTLLCLGFFFTSLVIIESIYVLILSLYYLVLESKLCLCKRRDFMSCSPLRIASQTLSNYVLNVQICSFLLKQSF